jgi:ABC-type transport system involved in multi-copper enzyme maturation permease subunit
MDNVLAIARSTYSQHAKSKALYLLWIVLIVLITCANRYDALSIGRSPALLIDLGMVLISLVGAGSVLVLGFEVPRELRQKVAENLLSKPVGRDQYLTGKFIGTVLFATTNVLFVAAGFCIVASVSHDASPRQMVLPLIGVFGMILMLAAAGAFFGAFMGEVPAVVATFLVFWLGHSSQLVAKMADQSSAAVHTLLRIIYGLLPNLDLLNTRSDLSQTLFAGAPAVTWSYVIASISYALLYSLVIFLAAILVFRQRDL